MIEFDTKTTAIPVVARTFTIGSKPSYQGEKGWECCRCGRVNAPWVRQCDCSGYQWIPTCDSDSTSSHEWWEPYIKGTVADCVGGSDYWDSDKNAWTNVTSHISNTVHGKKR